MGLTQNRRRIERLEARLHADSLADLSQFQFLWFEPVPDDAPLPPESHVEREVEWSGSLPDWGHAGLTFQYGTVRERVVAGSGIVLPTLDDVLSVGNIGNRGVRSREVRYSPLPSQLRFHESRARFKGFSGPVGSGKTLAICQEGLKLGYLNPGCLGVLAARTYRMLADVTRRQFLEILEANGIPYRYNKTDNSVVLTECNHTVLFRSLDQPERLIGTNLAWFGCDELSYAEDDSWRRLEARLRDPRARVLCGFGGWTPNSLNWVWRRFVSDEKIPGYELVGAQPHENRHILNQTSDYYDRLKVSYTERFYKQEVLGEYIPQYGGLVYYSFGEENVRELAYDSRLPLFWALDFNLNPLSSLIGQIVPVPGYQFDTHPPERMIHVLEEIVMPAAYTPEACEEFVERARKWRDRFTTLQVEIYGDPAGEQQHSSAADTDYDILRHFFARHPEFKVTYKYGRKAPLVKDRTNTVNGLLLNAAGQRRLFVAPGCRELLADLRQVSWKTDSSGNVLTALDKRDPARTHTSDALGYQVWEEFGENREARLMPQLPW